MAAGDRPSSAARLGAARRHARWFWAVLVAGMLFVAAGAPAAMAESSPIRIDWSESRWTFKNFGSEEVTIGQIDLLDVNPAGPDPDWCSGVTLQPEDSCQLRTDPDGDDWVTFPIEGLGDVLVALSPNPSVAPLKHSNALPNGAVFQYKDVLDVVVSAPDGVESITLAGLAGGPITQQLVCSPDCPATAKHRFHIATSDLSANSNQLSITTTDVNDVDSAPREWEVTVDPASCRLDALCASAAGQLDQLHAPALEDDPENAVQETIGGFETPDGAFIPDDIADPVEIGTGSGTLEVTVNDATIGAVDGRAAADAAVVYPGQNGASTTVRSTEKGFETFTVLPNASADPTVELELDIPGDQRLVEQDDGSVLLIDPTPPAAPAEPTTPLPADVPGGTPQSDELREEMKIPEDVPQADPSYSAADILEAASDDTATRIESGDGEDLPEAPDPNDLDPAAGAVPSGDESTPPPALQDIEDRAAELKDQLDTATATQTAQMLDEAEAFDEDRAEHQDAQAELTETRPVARIEPVWAKDADGEDVETELEIVGNVVSVTVQPDASTTYPIVVDPWVWVDDYEWQAFPVARYKTQYREEWVPTAYHVGWVHVGWCYSPGYSCAPWTGGWWGISPLGVFAQFNGTWGFYPSYLIYNQRVYRPYQVFSHWDYEYRYVATGWWEEFDDDPASEPTTFVSDDSWLTLPPGSQPTAQSAALPLLVTAGLWCVRICPAVFGSGATGVAASKYTVTKITPAAAKAIKQPAVRPALVAARDQWLTEVGSNQGRSLGNNLVKAFDQHLISHFGTLEKARSYLTKNGLRAHHIAAAKDPAAAQTTAILRKVGIKPNEAVNGVWIPKCYHECIHTPVYYRNINALFQKFETRAALGTLQRWEVEAELRWVAQRIARGDFPFM